MKSRACHHILLLFCFILTTTIWKVAVADEPEASAVWSSIADAAKTRLPCPNIALGVVGGRSPFLEAAEKIKLVSTTVLSDAKGSKLEVSLGKPVDNKLIRQREKNIVCIMVYDLSGAEPTIVKTQRLPVTDGTPRSIVFVSVKVPFSDLFTKWNNELSTKLQEPNEIGFRVLEQQDVFTQKWNVIAFDLHTADGWETAQVPEKLNEQPPHSWHINLLNFIKQVQSLGFESGFMARGPVPGNLVRSVNPIGVTSTATGVKIVYAGIHTNDNQYYVVNSECTEGQLPNSWYCSKPTAIPGFLIVQP